MCADSSATEPMETSLKQYYLSAYCKLCGYVTMSSQFDILFVYIKILEISDVIIKICENYCNTLLKRLTQYLLHIIIDC